MVKLIIDGKTVEVEEGETVLAAARKARVNIPTLCYHESLSPAGSCRLCVVEIPNNGIPGLVTACTYPVEAGLEVRTDTERVVGARRFALELLMAQQPHSEKIAKLAEELGVKKSKYTLKPDECILCGLCVRTCQEKVGVSAIDFIDQGKDRRNNVAMVVHSPEKCIGCDSCAYICPTEAITIKDVGAKRTLKTPSGKIEFKLKKCSKCGVYWVPEKQLEYITGRAGLPADHFDTCLNCRG